MQKINNVEMAAINGGADYVGCGIGVAVTIGSVFYFPLATVSLAEMTAMMCAVGA